MRQSIDIAGLGLLLDVQGEALRVAGHYQDAAPELAIAMELHVRVEADFAEGRQAAADFPAFQVEAVSDNCVKLSRYDAEGTIHFADGEPLRADFVVAPREVALEALLRILSSYTLLRHGGLVLHSSAIGDDQGAHVFSGVSGAGKSTIAALLRDYWPVEQLSDELLILRRGPEKWELIVSPFLGSKGLAHGKRKTLSSINFLSQADENRRTELRPAQAMSAMCRHILSYAQDPKSGELILELVMQLVSEVPCYDLDFLKDASVGQVLDLAC
ncbi:MAG: hypothetical protein JKY56_27785 [Kofleriaceae bacterium]|nr:hypothetical protein [Kofleriaceae bacterium]